MTDVSEYINTPDDMIKEIVQKYDNLPCDISDAERDRHYMSCALKLAEYASERGEVPVGCVIVKDNKIIGYDINRREETKDSTYHSEIGAIRMANKELHGWRLIGCTMYVTLEPCPMCAGAIINSRLERIVCAAKDYKAGALGSVINLNSYPLNFKTKIEYGLCEDESKKILRDFFLSRRKK